MNKQDFSILSREELCGLIDESNEVRKKIIAYLRHFDLFGNPIDQYGRDYISICSRKTAANDLRAEYAHAVALHKEYVNRNLLSK